MNGLIHSALCSSATLVCFFATNLFAAGPKVETVLTGLNTPYGIAVRPRGSAEKYEVFVADSTGNRIVRIRGDQIGSSTDAITGFDGNDTGVSTLFFLD